MGLLHTTDWQARWIEPGWNEDPAGFNPCPYLRTTFVLDEPIVSARLYVTAHGLYEAWLNGQRVGDACLTPGYTSYHHRLHYQIYDVADLLLPGENAIGVILGDDWYRGSIDVGPRRNVYGQTLGLLLQLQVRYADGRERLITSDEPWRATTGPIRKSDPQEGKIYNARLEMPGWNQPGFDASSWQHVRLVNSPLENLVATISPPVRRKERFVPATIFTTPAGETVVDMGQNFAGVVQLKVSGPKGATIRLQHGERLDKEGNFTLQNLALGPLPPSEQQPDGRVSNIVPSPGGEPMMGGLVHLLEGSAGWGDAAVIVPWTLYQVFGDQRILAE
jgi:alpha-L-rhamnosidase